MDNRYEKQELETQLARCRDLAEQFRDGLTAKHLRELEQELEQKLRSKE
jgi:hypothetical protein